MEVTVAFKIEVDPDDLPRVIKALGVGGADPAEGGAQGGPGRRRPRGPRAPMGSRLPEEAYRLPLLEALAEMGGSGTRKVVTEAVGVKLNDQLRPIDRERNGSGGIRWRNRVAWVRSHLIDEGLLKRGSPRGMWELTAKGWRVVLKYRPDLAA